MNKLILILSISLFLIIPTVSAEFEDSFQNKEIINESSFESEFQEYIIEFESPPILVKQVEFNKNKQILKSNHKFGVLNSNDIDNYKSELKNNNDKIKSNIKNTLESSNVLKIQLQYKQKPYVSKEFNYVINGITLNLTKEQVLEIENLEGVKTVWPDKKIKLLLQDSVSLIQEWIPSGQLDITGSDCTITGNDCLTGQGIKIAIIDTGVDYTHPDLGGCSLTSNISDGSCSKVIGGYDFVNNDNDPMDDQGHGTHVASTAAGNNTLKGVAPGAKILAYKVLNGDGEGSSQWILSAIEKAVLDGADVLSLSLGGEGHPDDLLSQAVDNAVLAGKVVVVAAGNSGSGGDGSCGDGVESICSPGTARGAITVGATFKDDNLASFSSQGPVRWNDSLGNEQILIKPDLVAPGVAICAARLPGKYNDSLCLGDTHAAISGTSMATPHVAGAAALLLESKPEMSPSEVKDLFKNTAIDIGYFDYQQGSGRINLSAILKYSHNYYFELNEPQTLVFDENSYYVEIVGGSDTNYIILDVNGKRNILYEGDNINLNGLNITASDIFITNIPTLSIYASLFILETANLNPEDTVFFELNDPNSYILNEKVYTIELIEGNNETNSIIINVNGINETFLEGDNFILNDLNITTVDIFVTNIPILSFSANLILHDNLSSFDEEWSVFQEVRSSIKERNEGTLDNKTYFSYNDYFEDMSECVLELEMTESECEDFYWGLLEAFMINLTQIKSQSDVNLVWRDNKQTIFLKNYTNESYYYSEKIFFIYNNSNEILFLSSRMVGTNQDNLSQYIDTDKDGRFDVDEDCSSHYYESFPDKCVETNSSLRDTDGDGFWDSTELLAYSNPNNNLSTPFSEPIIKINVTSFRNLNSNYWWDSNNSLNIVIDKADDVENNCQLLLDNISIKNYTLGSNFMGNISFVPTKNLHQTLSNVTFACLVESELEYSDSYLVGFDLQRPALSYEVETNGTKSGFWYKDPVNITFTTESFSGIKSYSQNTDYLNSSGGGSAGSYGEDLLLSRNISVLLNKSADIYFASYNGVGKQSSPIIFNYRRDETPPTIIETNFHVDRYLPGEILSLKVSAYDKESGLSHGYFNVNGSTYNLTKNGDFFEGEFILPEDLGSVQMTTSTGMNITVYMQVFKYDFFLYDNVGNNLSYSKNFGLNYSESPQISVYPSNNSILSEGSNIKLSGYNVENMWLTGDINTILNLSDFSSEYSIYLNNSVTFTIHSNNTHGSYNETYSFIVDKQEPNLTLNISSAPFKGFLDFNFSVNDDYGVKDVFFLVNNKTIKTYNYLSKNLSESILVNHPIGNLNHGNNTLTLRVVDFGNNLKLLNHNFFVNRTAFYNITLEDDGVSRNTLSNKSISSIVYDIVGLNGSNVIIGFDTNNISANSLQVIGSVKINASVLDISRIRVLIPLSDLDEVNLSEIIFLADHGSGLNETPLNSEYIGNILDNDLEYALFWFETDSFSDFYWGVEPESLPPASPPSSPSGPSGTTSSSSSSAAPASSTLRVTVAGKSYFFPKNTDVQVLFVDTYSTFRVEDYNNTHSKILFLDEIYYISENDWLKIDIEEDEIYDYYIVYEEDLGNVASIFIQKISENYTIFKNPPKSSIPISNTNVSDVLDINETEKTLTEQTFDIVKYNLLVPFIRWFVILGSILIMLLLGALVYERNKRKSKSQKLEVNNKNTDLKMSSGKNIYEEAQEKLSDGIEVPEKVIIAPILKKTPEQKVSPNISKKPSIVESHEIPELHITKPISKKVADKKLPETISALNVKKKTNITQKKIVNGSKKP